MQISDVSHQSSLMSTRNMNSPLRPSSVNPALILRQTDILPSFLNVALNILNTGVWYNTNILLCPPRLSLLQADLASLYIKAGVKNVGTVFLMTDAQVADEKFLVLVNDLLASGNGRPR